MCDPRAYLYARNDPAILHTSGVDVVALSRRADHRPAGAGAVVADYNDPPALRNALSGVDTLVLVTSDGELTGDAPPSLGDVLRHAES